jgi:hypothetical protein
MLAEADEQDAQQGCAPHQVPPSVFVRNGLQIEDQQYGFSVRVLHILILYHPRRQLVLVTQNKSLKSDTQKASIQEKRNILTRQIRKWREAQVIYMPGATTPSSQPPDSNADGNDIDGSESPESISLVLPSELETTRRNALCLHHVAEYEKQLRLAQLQDSLIELRRIRRIRYTLLVNHKTQVAGQGQRANTRSRSLISSVDDRITKFVQRYRAAYNALIRLDPTGTWQEMFLELKDQDNRGPGKEECERGLGDGSYELSWIWLSNPRTRDTSGTQAGDEGGASQEEVNDVMRVHWTTSYARAQRWTEEVDLLQEEMRRVVMFLQWKAEDWLAKQDVRLATATPSIQSGLRAYARKQAAVYHNLAVSFSKSWHPTFVSNGLNYSWITEYMKKHGMPFPDTDVATPQAQGVSTTTVLDGGPSQSSSSQHAQIQHLSNPTIYDDIVMLEEEVPEYYDDDYDNDSGDNNESEGNSHGTWVSFPLDTNSDDDSDGEFDLDFY